jgi:hypothetical protein
VLPLGVEELREDLAAFGLGGVEADYCATAMVAVGIELGVRMAEHDPPDVEGATRFATELFAGVLSRRS